jgi:2-hydroxycyclohexanecarboxyl-CoA dehydrogenase
MNSILDLRRRTALITGGGQGVGRQVALHFASSNAGAIVINDFVRDRAEAVAAEVEALGCRALAFQGDVSDFAAMQAMLGSINAAMGGLDILVNNAGNAGPASSFDELTPFWESDPDEWQRWFGTNLYGVLNVCRGAFPLMITGGHGRIITVVSDAGRVGEPHLAVYSAAKAGAAGFMRALAKAGGRYGITANCVSLGGIRTPGVEGLIPDEESIRRILRHYVIRRLGEPDDAAAMILFLASEAASWITGQTYPVNGGYSFAV